MLRLFPIFFSMLVFAMPLSMAGMEIFSWTLLVLWILYRLANFRSLSLKDLKVPGLIFLLVFLASMLYGVIFANHMSSQQRIGVIGDMRWVLLVTMYFDLFNKKFVSIKNLIYPLFFSLVIVNVFGFYQMFTGSDPFRDIEYLSSYQSGSLSFWRIKGFFSTPMTFGNTMGMWFIFLVGLWLGKDLDLKKHSRTFLVVGLITGAGAFFSLVRGAWLGVFFSLIFIGLFYRKAVLIGVFALSLLLAGLSYQFVPNIQKRVDATLSGKDTAITDRYIIWDSYWKLFRDNPVMGVGHRFTSELIVPYQNPEDKSKVLREHAHSNFLQVLSGLGLVGFLGFYGFFAYLIFLTFKWNRHSHLQWKERPLLLAALASAFCFHFSALTESTLLDWEVVHLYALMLGLTTHFLKQTMGQEVSSLKDAKS